MIRAARALSIRNGIGKAFRSVMREVTKPGQITETPIPSAASSGRSPSPQTRTAAFEAQ